MTTIAGVELPELDTELPLSAAAPVEALRARATALLESMAPRQRLSDGSFGYRAKAETTITVVAGSDPHAAGAPTETLKMFASESEIKVHDPVLTLDGALRIDLEILSYVVEGRSTVLFDGEPIRLIVGKLADPTLGPSYGRLEIPLDHDFGRVPIDSVQHIFLAVDTPLGQLRNPHAARMVSQVTAIPPVGMPYEQEGIVPLADPTGTIRAAKTATATMLTELLS